MSAQSKSFRSGEGQTVLRLNFRCWSVAALTFCCVANFSVVFAANKYLKQPNGSHFTGDAFFNETNIRTFHIDIPQPASLRLRQSPRTYVSATVTEGDAALTNVAVHLKGMGRFRSLDEKPSF